MEQARVRGSKINFAVTHGGRRYDPGALVMEGPAFFAGCHIHCIKLRIAAPEVHNPVRHSRRRLNSDLIVDLRIFACLESPNLITVAGVQSIEVTIPASNK